MIKKVLSRRGLIVFGIKFFGSSYLMASGLSFVKINKNTPEDSFGVEDRETPLFDCIVIGAGVSGLAIADELRNKSVLVLEASNRIGGRVFTDRKTFKRHVELGAEYIHVDPLDTPLWRKVHQYKMKLFVASKKNSYIFHPDLKSERVITSLSAAIRLGFINILKLFHLINYKGIHDISAENLLIAVEQQTNEKKNSVFLDFMRMLLSGHVGAPEKKLSMKGFRMDHYVEQMKNKTEYYIRSGYSSLIDRISENISIKLQEPVTKVTKKEIPLKDNFIYEVQTFSGKTFLTRSVCYSASIGVLKSNCIEFIPPLPSSKLSAIQQLEMSHHSKVHLEFTKIFWPQDMTMVNRLDQKRRLGKTYFVAYSDDSNAPPILTALIMGNDAIKLYSMTEEEIITNVGLDLQDCFPEVDIFSLLNRDISGKPSAKITIWGKNEFVRGGLSYIKLDQNNSLPVELVRPTYASSQETPGLFWAGEAAAIYEQPASVHGAYSAGLRASVEIEHFLNDKILKDEKQIAQIYHQKFGLKKEMDWHSNIVRSAQEGDTEVDWQDKFSVLLEEDRV